MRILIAEDEQALSRALVKILEKNNFSADAVDNGEDALTYLRSGNYDAAILDIMMPRMDGLTLLRRLRAEKMSLPVLLLTARSETQDKVEGLDSGANDYLTKPFEVGELLARLRAMTRAPATGDSRITAGNTTLDRASFELSAPLGSFRLANKEFQLMELFMSNPRSVISTERIMERIWGYDSDAEINVVWVYISYLRKKLAALGSDIRIIASRNAGYRLEEHDDPEA